IRTWDMHHAAEFGIAAHWRYKEGKKTEGRSVGKPDIKSDDNTADTPSESKDSLTIKRQEEKKLEWLGQILEWQRETLDNQEYLKALKADLDVYNEFVYCFTPKGSVLQLVKGSIAIDFAYSIHSDIGNRMIGVKVNGKMENKDYILKSGDRVEILTSKNSKGPTLEWINLVKTGQAKSKIRQWLSKQGREENRQKGRELLESAAKKKGVDLAVLMEHTPEKNVLVRFGQRDFEALCASVGQGAVREGQVVNYLYNEYLLEKNRFNPQDIIDSINAAAEIPQKSNLGDIIINGVENPATHYAKCCTPVPGDEIIGFVTRGRGVSIHRTDCVNVANFTNEEKSRLIEVLWNIRPGNPKRSVFRAELSITCENNMELLVPISMVFVKSKAHVLSINTRESNDNTAIFNISVNVGGTDHIKLLYSKLMVVPGIYEVERIKT
ncbi:MAG: TGS domain-containing protein, partial [Defluviitaleaceae bacterium]|nr:TGS domain-containing protein [Defluviitaleaceae bacterium]